MIALMIMYEPSPTEEVPERKCDSKLANMYFIAFVWMKLAVACSARCVELQQFLSSRGSQKFLATHLSTTVILNIKPLSCYSPIVIHIKSDIFRILQP